MCFFRIVMTALLDRRKINIFILVIAFTGCSGKPNTFSILGNWSGTVVTISGNARHESVTEPVKRFGYINFDLHADSSYELSLAVLKDVKTERTIFGISQNVVLLKAVYTTSRFGKLMKQDTDFVCTS